MKVLIAPDKFKGTLSATEAAAAMAEGVAMYNPAYKVQLLPIADGGEGTAEILSRVSGGELVHTRAADPLLRQVTCGLALSGDGQTAFIDIASASGFAALQPHEINVMSNSTIGTGQLIAHAIGRRCKRIVLGLGGSATMDCGMGIAHALGVVFTGEAGVRLSPIAGSLRKVEYISRDNLRPEVPRTEILLLTDVSNALLGEDGALQYAAQKGLKEVDRPKLDAALHHFANLMEALYGTNCKLPGMGAAGGAALCCVGLLGAKMAPGAAFVLEALQAPVAIADADIILTGEGHLDAQSLRGKAAVSLARLAQVQGKPVAAICGQVSLGDTELRSAGIDLAMSLYATGVDLDSIRAATYRALVLKTREMMEEMSVKLL